MNSGDGTQTIDFIGPIYDTVIDPGLWPDLLDRLRRHFAFHNAILAVQALPRGEIVVQAAAGVPPEYLALVPHYENALIELWGGAARLHNFPLEEPIIQSQAAAGTNYTDNSYYRDWVRPQGILDAVAIALARDETIIGTMGFGRHETAPPISEAQIGGLRLLAPHIRRAVTISRLLEVSVAAASTFESALEATRRGIVIVEKDLTIVFANTAARPMLEAQDPIRSVDGKLAIREELAAGHLEAAVRIACTDEGQLGRHGIAMPTLLRDGTPLAVHVMPLRRRPGRGRAERQGAAAVFIAEAGSSPALPGDAMGLIYGLTPAETRVFDLVIAGHSTKQAARMLAVAPSTMRTHLLAVFAKTGRHNRADLMRLSREISLPN